MIVIASPKMSVIGVNLLPCFKSLQTLCFSEPHSVLMLSQSSFRKLLRLKRSATCVPATATAARYTRREIGRNNKNTSFSAVWPLNRPYSPVDSTQTHSNAQTLARQLNLRALTTFDQIVVQRIWGIFGGKCAGTRRQFTVSGIQQCHIITFRQCSGQPIPEWVNLHPASC